jgi:hypothetical protein
LFFNFVEKAIMKKKPVFQTDKKKPADPKSQTDIGTERDLDEQIHAHESELGEENNNEDPDDLVHDPRRNKARQLNQEDQPVDPDDLVHENADDDDE